MPRSRRGRAADMVMAWDERAGALWRTDHGGPPPLRRATRAPGRGALAQQLLGWSSFSRIGRAGLGVRAAHGASRELQRDQDLGGDPGGPASCRPRHSAGRRGVRDRVSRGQQKLLAAILLLAQIKLFPKDSRAQPTLLLDDPAAELDGEHLRMLLDEVREQPVQLIVTTLQAGSAELAGFGTPGRRFEIDGGSCGRCNCSTWNIRRAAAPGRRGVLGKWVDIRPVPPP